MWASDCVCVCVCVCVWMHWCGNSSDCSHAHAHTQVRCSLMTPYWLFERENRQMPQGRLLSSKSRSARSYRHWSDSLHFDLCVCLPSCISPWPYEISREGIDQVNSGVTSDYFPQLFPWLMDWVSIKFRKWWKMLISVPQSRRWQPHMSCFVHNPKICETVRSKDTRKHSYLRCCYQGI